MTVDLLSIARVGGESFDLGSARRLLAEEGVVALLRDVPQLQHSVN